MIAIILHWVIYAFAAIGLLTAVIISLALVLGWATTTEERCDQMIWIVSALLLLLVCFIGDVLEIRKRRLEREERRYFIRRFGMDDHREIWR